MKLKSISGLVFYVKNTAKTVKFYESLGFIITKNQPDHISVRLNWFWMDFHPQDKEDKPEFQKEANLTNKGAGLFIYVNVEDVDEFYNGVVKRGLKPSSKPKDYEWGNREFVIRDPDGYKLVFFTKK